METSARQRSVLAVVDLDRAAFLALGAEWPTLLGRTGHVAPFYQHEFLAAWMRSFAPTAHIHVVAVRDESGLRAALCLHEVKERRLGMSVKKLAGTANVHSARFDLIASASDHEAIAAIWSFVRDKLEWDMLELPDVPPLEEEQGAARILVDMAQDDGLPTGLWESMRTPYIPLGASLESVLERTSSKFRSNLRRRRRKLTEQGELVVERYTGTSGNSSEAQLELERKLNEGLQLEASGWKGQEGTAIASDPATRSFYAELARAAAERGYLSLFFLRCAGRAVAFHFGLTLEGRYYLFKLGFDEGLGACSPGQLIVENVLADGCARGLREFDFLGPNMPWKRDWTEHERVHHWCYAFRTTTLGRALHAAKFKVAPLVKEVLQWKH